MPVPPDAGSECRRWIELSSARSTAYGAAKQDVPAGTCDPRHLEAHVLDSAQTDCAAWNPERMGDDLGHCIPRLVFVSTTVE